MIMPPARRPDDREQTRAAVGARYAALARAAQAGQPVSDCDPAEFAAGRFGPAGYLDTGGLPEGAVRASLGCGNPVAVADLRPGETVLDLGCGGGIDVLLSARRVGPAGKAYGLDMTGEMLDLARAHALQAGAENAEFLLGQIEAIPLPDNSVDVIISNCVINLSADRPAVFAESFRVLRPGGRLGVTDILAEDRLIAARRLGRGAQAGCIAGAPSFTEYRRGLAAAGFTAITITPTHEAADGVHSAVIRAARPLPVPVTVQACASTGRPGREVRRSRPGAARDARYGGRAQLLPRRSWRDRRPEPGRGRTSAPRWPGPVPRGPGRRP
jgi:SAM-dependent methyltransferase